MSRTSRSRVARTVDCTRMRSAMATRWCGSTLPANEARAPFGIRIATGGMCSKESGIESSRTFTATSVRCGLSAGRKERRTFGRTVPPRDVRVNATLPFGMPKTEDEWQKALNPEQFYVLRKHGTEPPGSSALNAEKRHGTFKCAGCGQPLFSSDSKFESGTGWPSFSAPLGHAIKTSTDRSLFMTRVEVHCAECGGHLGHEFPDGPAPTGKRYCMNGVPLKFEPQDPR